MDKEMEDKIIETINKKHISREDSLELIDDLYWADWAYIESNHPDDIGKIFDYIEREDLSIEEISGVLRLYNNPDGSYIEKFSRIILEIYKRDKVKFIKALTLEKDEASNLAYLFRNEFVKLDEDKELLELSKSDKLNEEEKETAEGFIKFYENACST